MNAIGNVIGSGDNLPIVTMLITIIMMPMMMPIRLPMMVPTSAPWLAPSSDSNPRPALPAHSGN